MLFQQKPGCYLLVFLFISPAAWGRSKLPDYYRQDKSFSDSLHTIIKDVGLDGQYDTEADGRETISFAVIDLSGNNPVFAGSNDYAER